jgi:hypothetical protein
MLGKINVTIKGVCPLLMSRDSGDRTKIKDPSSTENKTKEFDLSQYKDKKGKLVLWAEHLEKCLEVTGQSVKFKGMQRYGKIICGGLFIEPQEIPLKIKGGVEPFEKFVRIPPRTGARVLKTRAKISNWEATFTVNVVNDDINADALKDIITKAGIHTGLLSWRPKYGRFEVTKFIKE